MVLPEAFSELSSNSDPTSASFSSSPSDEEPPNILSSTASDNSLSGIKVSVFWACFRIIEYALLLDVTSLDKTTRGAEL